jgi:hypothetical protein
MAAKKIVVDQEHLENKIDGSSTSIVIEYFIILVIIQRRLTDTKVVLLDKTCCDNSLSEILDRYQDFVSCQAYSISLPCVLNCRFCIHG